MDATVLDSLPVQLDIEGLFRSLRVREGSGQAEQVRRLAAEAAEIGRPKAIYRIGYIDAREPDQVVVDGFRFTSRVLRVNLETANRIFAYVCTAGQELEAWMASKEDMLDRYSADVINEHVLGGAGAALREHLQTRYEVSRTATMNPGSLADWPLKEQRPLFAFLGDPETAIGVKLLDSLLMSPQKTVSGILFPTEETFASCQLCPRAVCPNRRAPYDPELFERKYRETAG